VGNSSVFSVSGLLPVSFNTQIYMFMVCKVYMGQHQSFKGGPDLTADNILPLVVPCLGRDEGQVSSAVIGVPAGSCCLSEGWSKEVGQALDAVRRSFILEALDFFCHCTPVNAAAKTSPALSGTPQNACCAISATTPHSLQIAMGFLDKSEPTNPAGGSPGQQQQQGHYPQLPVASSPPPGGVFAPGKQPRSSDVPLDLPLDLVMHCAVVVG